MDTFKKQKPSPIDTHSKPQTKTVKVVSLSRFKTSQDQKLREKIQNQIMQKAELIEW